MQREELVGSFLRRMADFNQLMTRGPLSEHVQGELRVLSYLYVRHGEDVLPGDLSASFSLSTARITAMLNKLEKKGMITREISEKDRRKINVSLTPEGLRLFREKHQVGIEILTSLLAELGERDARELIRIFDRIIEITERRTANGGVSPIGHCSIFNKA